MSFVAATLLTLFTSIVAVFTFKRFSIYLLFFTAYLQNLFLAYSYTSGYIGRSSARAGLLFKDFLLAELMLYSIYLINRRRPGWRWPRPILILGVFSTYCLVRFIVGGLFFADFSADGLRKLRMMFFPIEILIVAIAFRELYPEITKKIIRHVTYFCGVLAVAAILLFLFARTDFWRQHADIAAYNVEVKGDDPSSVIEDQGVPGTAAGREAFLFLSSFRAMGTFADPLALGFAMAVPVSLLTFYYMRNSISLTLLVITSAALFFTFSRSAWIFTSLCFVFTLAYRRHFRLLLFLFVAGGIAIATWRPLAEFVASGYSMESWTNPEGKHAQGIIWFYQRAFVDPGNLLGKGMDDSVQEIPENGYAFLIEHFGAIAYVSFVAFCISLFQYFRSRITALGAVAPILIAIPAAILIIMHFSQYPFAFTEFLFIWFLIGSYIRPSSDSRELTPGIDCSVAA